LDGVWALFHIKGDDVDADILSGKAEFREPFKWHVREKMGSVSAQSKISAAKIFPCRAYFNSAPSERVNAIA
jgi:hypothetical protein